jgi:exonuclease VII small subunit
MSQISEDEAEVQKVKYATLGSDGQGTPADAIRPAVRQAAYQLVGLIQSTLQYARTQLDDKELQIDKVYLSGGGARINNIDQYFKSALKTEVEFLDPFRRIDISLAQSSGDEELTSLPSDLAVAVGLAHIGNDRHRYPVLSLVPDRVRERRRFFTRVPFLVASVAALFLTMAILTVTYKVQEDQKSKSLAEVEQIVKRLEADQAKLSELEAQFRRIYAKYDTLQNQNVTARGLMETYAKLRRLARDGLQVEKIELKDAGTVKRAIVNVPEQGHVVGTFQSEDEEHIVLKEQGQLKKGEAAFWEGPSYRIQIYGEIDENIKGGPNELLLEMKRQLTDPATGTTADILIHDASQKRPGWHRFQIEVKLQ